MTLNLNGFYESTQALFMKQYCKKNDKEIF